MRNFILLLFSFIILSACNNGDDSKVASSVAGENPFEIPPLHERSGALASAAEWQKTKIKIEDLKARLAKNPKDIKARLQVATIYITEARITGEHPYYYPVLNKILDGVLKLDPNSFEALVMKASVKMSQHKFGEAKELAERAKAINPNNAYTYGILVDANVELGNYDDAIAASDKMQALKPSLESYSRASYLREIYGDNQGAIEAMKMAVDAGLPGSEPQSWSGNVLGQLYFNSGEIDKAETEYRKVLALRPSYAFAMAGLAKVEQKRKNYDAAIKLLDSAAAIMPEFSFFEQKGDIYALQGDNTKAQQQYEAVIKMLREDEQSGHSVSLELAKVYSKMAQFDSANKYAMQEYSVRPNNIDVNQELAWIAYKQNNKDKAKEYLQVARRTGSKDPALMERVSAIGQ